MRQTFAGPGDQRPARTGGWAAVLGAIVAVVLGLAVLLGPDPQSWTSFRESLGPTAAPPSTGGPSAGGPSPGPTAPGSTTPDVPSSTPIAGPDRPTPGTGASPTWLGVPPPAPPGGGPHVFTSFQANGVTPVAYDPCRAVHYVIRPDGSPEGGEELIHAAVARLSETTGLQFVHDGATDEPLRGEREPFQPERYGDRWAPVLFGWETEEENPALAGVVVGQGGSVAASLGDGPRVYVTGTVSLDAGQFPDILGKPDGAATALGIVLHEMAHLVGLAHVDDDDQLMYSSTRAGVTDFAAGDLTGLSRLGRGVCVDEL